MHTGVYQEADGGVYQWGILPREVRINHVRKELELITYEKKVEIQLERKKNNYDFG